MIWLTLIRDIIKIFREGQTPAQVAGGFALGSLIGLSPVFTLQGAIIWLIILLVNVNLGAVFLSFAVCGLAAYLLDPLFHRLGYFLLVNVDFLQGFWTFLYNAPVAPLTRFNNTVVLGGFVSALLLFVPVYVGMKRLVVSYRQTIGKRIAQWKIYQMIRSSSLVKLYEKIRDLRG
jgi:uncharacterized protein (TIGR03546 family)